MPMPKSNIDFSVLDALLQFKVSIMFCADHLGCSEASIRRRILEKFDMTFTEYHKLKMEKTSFTLKSKVINEVIAEPMKNASLTTFTLKNISGWTDKVEQTGSTDVSVKLNYNLED